MHRTQLTVLLALISAVCGPFSSVRAHETYSPEVNVPTAASESIPGFEAYEGAEYYLDAPMLMTNELFFEQVIEKEQGIIRSDNIFSKENDSSTPQRWLLWFTAEENPRYVCSTCASFGQSINAIANELLVEQPESNFKVAKINCVQQTGHQICDYFKIQSMPQIIVLRPDLDHKYFAFWQFARNFKTTDYLLDFVMEDYAFAYTQGALPSGLKMEQMNFKDQFATFSSEFFTAVMEESYSMMLDYGLADHPKHAYNNAYAIGCFALASPMFLVFYLRGIYSLYNYFRNMVGAGTKKETVENDPDFEPDTDAAPSSEKDSKSKKKD